MYYLVDICGSGLLIPEARGITSYELKTFMVIYTVCMQSNENVDITFSAHDAFLEKTTSGTFKAKMHYELI
jgi:hypothetical protein